MWEPARVRAGASVSKTSVQKPTQSRISAKFLPLCQVNRAPNRPMNRKRKAPFFYPLPPLSILRRGEGKGGRAAPFLAVQALLLLPRFFGFLPCLGANQIRGFVLAMRRLRQDHRSQRHCASCGGEVFSPRALQIEIQYVVPPRTFFFPKGKDRPPRSCGGTLAGSAVKEPPGKEAATLLIPDWVKQTTESPLGVALESVSSEIGNRLVVWWRVLISSVCSCIALEVSRQRSFSWQHECVRSPQPGIRVPPTFAEWRNPCGS